jgi:hypothetical protein
MQTSTPCPYTSRSSADKAASTLSRVEKKPKCSSTFQTQTPVDKLTATLWRENSVEKKPLGRSSSVSRSFQPQSAYSSGDKVATTMSSQNSVERKPLGRSNSTSRSSSQPQSAIASVDQVAETLSRQSLEKQPLSWNNSTSRSSSNPQSVSNITSRRSSISKISQSPASILVNPTPILGRQSSIKKKGEKVFDVPNVPHDRVTFSTKSEHNSIMSITAATEAYLQALNEDTFASEAQ